MLGKIVVNAIALYVVGYLLPGFRLNGFSALMVASIVWAIMTTLVRPILVILTLPINIMSLGLFTFILNGFLLYITSQIVPGFVISNLGSAVLGWIILSIVSSVLNSL